MSDETPAPDRSGGYPAGDATAAELDAPLADWVDDGSRAPGWPDADPTGGDKRPGTWPTSPLDLLGPAPAPPAEEDPEQQPADKVELLGYVRDRRDVPAALAELLRSDQEATAGPAPEPAADAPAEPWPPVAPTFTAWLSVYRGAVSEDESGGPEPAFVVNVTGPARFVDRVIAAAADGFVSHVER